MNLRHMVLDLTWNTIQFQTKLIDQDLQRFISIWRSRKYVLAHKSQIGRHSHFFALSDYFAHSQTSMGEKKSGSSPPPRCCAGWREQFAIWELKVVCRRLRIEKCCSPVSQNKKNGFLHPGAQIAAINVPPIEVGPYISNIPKFSKTNTPYWAKVGAIYKVRWNKMLL